ncbi:MAG: hypothetical protein ACYC97_01045 [Metallibacterium sp.]
MNLDVAILYSLIFRRRNYCVIFPLSIDFAALDARRARQGNAYSSLRGNEQFAVMDVWMSRRLHVLKFMFALQALLLLALRRRACAHGSDARI